MKARWSALDAACERRVPRVPFVVDGCRVGSVATAHLPALGRFTTWLRVGEAAIELQVQPPARDAALAQVNGHLRTLGLVRAWRDEPFALPDPVSGKALALMERAAARFWGTLTLGAHATGYVRGGAGRITHMWIARRSPHKATDPGLYDNLVGGGVPAGQTPREALVREGFEEAGLAPAQIAPARAAGVLRLHRDIAEGLQHEWLYAFDLELDADTVPVNQDGEVAGFTLMSVTEAAALAGGGAMTVDAAVVTLDFLVRHGLVDADADADAALRRGLDALRVATPADPAR